MPGSQTSHDMLSKRLAIIIESLPQCKHIGNVIVKQVWIICALRMQCFCGILFVLVN